MLGYRASFGYVPEEAHVYTHLSGLEYLQLVGRLRGIWRRRVIEFKANRLLALLGLESWQALADFALFEGDEAAGADCGGVAA